MDPLARRVCKFVHFWYPESRDLITWYLWFWEDLDWFLLSNPSFNWFIRGIAAYTKKAYFYLSIKYINSTLLLLLFLLSFLLFIP